MCVCVHTGVGGASSPSTLAFLLSVPWLEEASLPGSVIFLLDLFPPSFCSLFLLTEQMGLVG